MDGTTAANRIAWVTGASSGIGRAVALKLADNGWQVAASARSKDKLAALAAERPGHIHPYPVDVTDGQAVKETVLAVERMVGPIGLALFSAGRYEQENARRFDASKLADMVHLNIIGTGYSLEAVIGPMIGRKSGRIGVIASVAGYVGLPGGGFYGATKAALINLCEALRPQLERDGVTLQVINPGFVDTPLTRKNDFPMPFLIPEGEAADAIVKGLQGHRFEIVFPWKMALTMKLMRAMPYGLVFAVTRKMLRQK